MSPLGDFSGIRYRKILSFRTFLKIKGTIVKVFILYKIYQGNEHEVCNFGHSDSMCRTGLSYTYRPYVYENHIDDFHLADVIGSIVCVPAAVLCACGIHADIR